MSIKIVTDSSSDILTLNGVEFASAPLKIITADKEYVDDENLDVFEMVNDLHSYKGKSCWGNGHAKAIENFYQHLSGKGGSYLPLTEAIPATEFVFEVYRQAFGRE